MRFRVEPCCEAGSSVSYRPVRRYPSTPLLDPARLRGFFRIPIPPVASFARRAFSGFYHSSPGGLAASSRRVCVCVCVFK